MSKILLEVKEMSKSFGGLKATQNVSISIPQGEICAMVGPNGAGKSTLFNLISRSLNPDQGDVLWQGESLLKYPRHKLVGLGIAKTAQNLSLFRLHNAFENVTLGYHSEHEKNLLHAIFRTKRYREAHVVAVEKAMEKLEMVGLKAKAKDMAGQLPYGEQKRLELARALVSNPKLLMLDEPATGLNPAEQKEFGKLLLSIRDQGVTIFIIEHSMKLVQQISDRVLFLVQGSLMRDCEPKTLLSDPMVKEIYLGKRAV